MCIMLNISLFLLCSSLLLQETPRPFYRLAKHLYPGRYRVSNKKKTLEYTFLHSRVFRERIIGVLTFHFYIPTYGFFFIANVDPLPTATVGQKELASAILYPKHRLVGTVGRTKRGLDGGGAWIIHDIEMCTV